MNEPKLPKILMNIGKVAFCIALGCYVLGLMGGDEWGWGLILPFLLSVIIGVSSFVIGWIMSKLHKWNTHLK